MRSVILALIWLNSAGIEISRSICYVTPEKTVYTFVERAPETAHAMQIGLRVYCDGCVYYRDSFSMEIEGFDDPVLEGPGFLDISAEWLRKRLTDQRTIDINIEPVSFCNLRCRWCSLDHTKEKEYIIPELFQSVLEKIAQSPVPIRRIDIHNAGEVLLHPEFPRLMDILGSVRSRWKNFPYTAMLTNGMRLDAANAEAILRYHTVDMLRVSVDGGTRQEYERIRIGGNFDTVRGNMERFVAMNEQCGHHITTGIICIVDDAYPLSTDWMDESFRKLFARVDTLDLRRHHNWDGSVDFGLHETAQVTGRCQFMKNNNLVILPDGRVTICCADLNARGVIGDIRNDSIHHLLDCSKRSEILRLAYQGRRYEVDLCKDCRQP